MFKELYYWMYNQLAKIELNDDPLLNAYFVIGILQILNIITIFIVINYFFKIQFFKNASIYIGITLAVVILIINYFTLYAKSKKIFQEYVGMQPKRKAKGLIFFWLYVSLSIIIFLAVAAKLISPR